MARKRGNRGDKYGGNRRQRINQLRASPGRPVWQRNYWERVIRNERELRRLREYIANNPLRWELDQLYPEAGTSEWG